MGSIINEYIKSHDSQLHADNGQNYYYEFGGVEMTDKKYEDTDSTFADKNGKVNKYGFFDKSTMR